MSLGAVRRFTKLVPNVGQGAPAVKHPVIGCGLSAKPGLTVTTLLRPLRSGLIGAPSSSM